MSNNLLILRFNENNLEIANLKKAGLAYQFESTMIVDKEVGSETLRQQLLNLALRKSGMQMKPQGVALDNLLASVDKCRKELSQYDSEITLPDGRIVEIEQYEYENAVLVQTNKITDDIRKAMGSSAIDKAIIIADIIDIPLLRSVFLRNFATSIGKSRPEAEWLSINDKATADKALAEASTSTAAQADATNIRDRFNLSKDNAPAVEGAYTGQQTAEKKPASKKPAPSKPKPRSQSTRRTNTSGSNVGNNPLSSLTQGGGKSILIVAGGIFGAIVLGIIIVAIMASSRKNSYDDYASSFDSAEPTEITSPSADSFDSAESSDSDDSSDASESTSSPGSYDYVYSESDGLRKVRKDSKYGFIDKNGKEIVPPIYDYIYSESDGLIKVEKDGLKGMINKQGKVVIPVKYDYIYSKSDNLFKVELNGKKGFVRPDGTVFMEAKYDYIYSKSDEMYKVELNNKKGFVDANTGKEICAPIFDYIYSFSGGLAKVEKDGKTGYINKQGKLVQPME